VGTILLVRHDHLKTDIFFYFRGARKEMRGNDVLIRLHHYLFMCACGGKSHDRRTSDIADRQTGYACVCRVGTIVRLCFLV